jgi:hypothetical protein
MMRRECRSSTGITDSPARCAAGNADPVDWYLRHWHNQKGYVVPYAVTCTGTTYDVNGVRM